MITFLYGPDTYRLRQELNKIIKEKKANSAWLDFTRIDINDKGIDFSVEIKKSINNISMFDKKKLIVIENVFSLNKEAQEDLLEILENVKNTDIVLVHEKPDSRVKLFKFLKDKSKEFELLKGSQLRKWIKEY